MVIVKEAKKQSLNEGVKETVFNIMVKSAEEFITKEGVTAERLEIWPTSFFEDWSSAFRPEKAWNAALKKKGLGKYTL